MQPAKKKLLVTAVLLISNAHIVWLSVQKSMALINVIGVPNFRAIKLMICWNVLPSTKESARKFALNRSIVF